MNRINSSYVLKGTLEYRHLCEPKVKQHKEKDWYAIDVILSDGNDSGKIIIALSLSSSVELYNGLLPEIMKLHKKIYDHGDGEYQFDPEIIAGYTKSILCEGEEK